MRLHAAATHFNRMVCTDAYSGKYLFNGQLGLFDDSKKDTEGSERRILELAPGTALPSRGVIEADGVRFILGHGYADSALGKPIRVKYVAHEATALAKVRTLEQVCLGSAGTDIYSARAWIKDSKEISESSEMIGVNHLHFSIHETLNVNDTVLFGGQLHIVRKINAGAAGTLIATCDEIGKPDVETCVYSSVTFDPVTENKSTLVVTLTAVRLRWQSLFEYRDQIAKPFLAEDSQVVIAKSVVTPHVGSSFTLSDGLYNVTSTLDRPGVWVCKVARHG